MTGKPKQPKLNAVEMAAARKRDAEALAQMIYDIYIEQKFKMQANDDKHKHKHKS